MVAMVSDLRHPSCLYALKADFFLFFTYFPFSFFSLVNISDSFHFLYQYINLATGPISKCAQISTYTITVIQSLMFNTPILTIFHYLF